MITMIRYLVKFVSKEAYADDLLSGKLFMHCARYYHDLETKHGLGQGDLREGSVIPGYACYLNVDFPIFCTYIIKDDDIKDNRVLIDKRMVEDFNCQQGFMVVIPFEPFEKALLTANTEGFGLIGAEVRYGTPNIESSKRMLVSKDPINLIVKDSYYKYQKEYRLIVQKHLDPNNDSACSGKERTYTCCLAEPLSVFAKKAPISCLKEMEEGFVLNLTDILKDD